MQKLNSEKQEYLLLVRCGQQLLQSGQELTHQLLQSLVVV